MALADVTAGYRSLARGHVDMDTATLAQLLALGAAAAAVARTLRAEAAPESAVALPAGEVVLPPRVGGALPSCGAPLQSAMAAASGKSAAAAAQAALSAPFELPPFFFVCKRASEVQLRLSSANGEEPVARQGEDLALVLEGVVRARGARARVSAVPSPHVPPSLTRRRHGRRRSTLW